MYNKKEKSDQNNIIDIEENLRSICSKIKKKGREIFADFDITPPQFEALLILIREGELTIGELSNKMFLACSTVTDLLDRMEKHCLVKRVRDENDRRITRVKVLNKGNVLIEEALNNRRKYLKNVLKDFNEDQIIQVDECLELLNEKMKI